DAEAGRNTGGQINVVSRFGANDIHGDVYDLFTDSSLNARDFFDLKFPGSPIDKPAFTRNQIGATIGIPLIKNRLHFFGGFEHQDLNRAQEVHFAVPSQQERANSVNFAHRVIGSPSRLGADVLDLYPLPNNPS